MAELKLSCEQINALEFQTEQAFTSLKRAITTKSYDDAVWSESLYAALGERIKEISGDSSFSGGRMDTEEADVFARYTLQYVVGKCSASILKNILESNEYDNNVKDSKITKQDLISTIDNRGNLYSQVWGHTMDFTKSHDFDAIKDVIEHIRNEYEKPKVLV